MLTAAQKGSIPPTPSIHRLQCGLPGYLILFAPPHFRASASVTVQLVAFATGVPPNLYAFHRYTGNSTNLSCTQARQYPKQFPTLKAGLSLQTYRAAYAPFTPNYSGQRLPPTYYRGCWHVVSRGFLLGYRLLLVSKDRSLRSENLLPPRGVAGSEFPPLPNIPHCCLPVGVWAVSQSQCGRSPSQVGYRSSAWWAVTSPTT